MKSLELKWKTKGESFYLVKIDVEERRLGSKKGLDTQVFLSVNDEWLVIQFTRLIPSLTGKRS